MKLPATGPAGVKLEVALEAKALTMVCVMFSMKAAVMFSFRDMMLSVSGTLVDEVVVSAPSEVGVVKSFASGAAGASVTIQVYKIYDKVTTIKSQAS